MSKGKFLLFITGLLLVALAAPAIWFGGAGQRLKKYFDRNEPDLPAKTRRDAGELFEKEEYLLKRQEQIDLYTGADTARQDSRVNAIRELERAEVSKARFRPDAPSVAWTALGPAPIPNGQTVGRTDPVSGRTSAIAIHPTDPNIVYVGTAQGGLYRTLDGGLNWTPLMDSATTLAIGALALAPTDPTILYVGTGESTQCGSGCFHGVGVYRINNANTTAVLTGPLNKDSANNDVFTGRGISEILVLPTDANTIFVSTTSGIAGIGSNVTGLTPLPVRGIYKSTNAAGAAPTFALLPFPIADRNITDLVMDPANPNNVWAGVINPASPGPADAGVFATTDFLSASPTWTLVQATTVLGSQSRVELAATNVAGVTTVMAATGEGTGTTYKSVGGAPWTTVLDNNFCNAQCFYDIAIAIDPTNADNVYLAGSPVLPFGRSTNGGTSYTASSTGLHVDSHVIAIAPSNPSIIYFGSDGGVWKSADAGVSWTSLNNTMFSATQFMSIAIHPNDTNYTLGGTQDNGTNYLFPNGSTWLNSDGGDGGFVVIDQTSTSPTTTVSYHTYYNATDDQIGFSRALTNDAMTGDPLWGPLLGCNAPATTNGIASADHTLFYPPMVGGPVATDSALRNTLYFGTDKLYRSANTGTTMTAVSQTLTGFVAPSNFERVSAIGISPQNDDVRLIGSTFGKVYYSNTAAATTMTDITGTMPARYVARIVFSPTDQNTAYVALNGYGIPNQHVMKSTNLNAVTPTWTNAGVGIPDAPTNALVIDPLNANHIYAGTDIGVFQSTDGGATWLPFGTGLPRVAVFGMAIQSTARILRIATHGKGMWQTSIAVSTAAGVSVSGRVLSSDGRGLKNARVMISAPDGKSWTVPTGRNGRYQFDDIPSGQTYVVSVASRRYRYEPRTLTLEDSVTGFDFVPEE